MLNCYWRIFTTYFTKFRAWVYRAILFCLALITLAYGERQPIGLAELFIIFYFLATLLHLKRQLAVPQATLIPHYRPRHMIVAGFLLLPVLILTPVCASIGFHIPLLPIMGLTLAFFALAGWAAYFQFLPLTIVAVALGAVPLNDTASKIAAPLLMQPPIGMVPLLFIGGLIGFGFLALRMIHLSEEMPEYARNNPLFGGESATSSNGFRISSKPDYNSPWQRFFSAASDRSIDRVASSSRKTFLQRVARSRAPTKNRTVLLMPVFICVTALFIDSQVKSGMVGVPFTWMMLWFLPISASLGIAIRRRPLLGYESLRPISRHHFLTELAFAVGLQFTEVWLSIAAALVFAAAISTPHLLVDPHAWLYLAVSYLVQWVLLAIVLWLLRFTTNMLLFMPIFMLPILVAPFGSILGGSPHAPSFYVAVILGVFVLTIFLTALILYDAYRRWLLTDLA